MNTNGTDVGSPELIVVVAVGVLATGRPSRRTSLSEPLPLLGAGCLVGLTPAFAGFALSPTSCRPWPSRPSPTSDPAPGPVRARFRRVLRRRNRDRCRDRTAPDPRQAPAARAPVPQRAECCHPSPRLPVRRTSARVRRPRRRHLRPCDHPVGPRVIGSDARIQAIAFWEVAGYLLNSALFILVGIQLPPAVGALTSLSLA